MSHTHEPGGNSMQAPAPTLRDDWVYPKIETEQGVTLSKEARVHVEDVLRDDNTHGRFWLTARIHATDNGTLTMVCAHKSHARDDRNYQLDLLAVNDKTIVLVGSPINGSSFS